MRRPAVVLLAVLALVPALAGCGSNENQRTSSTGASGGDKGQVKLGPSFGSYDKLPGVLTGKPPWPANVDRLRARLKAIGLPALSSEGTVLHIHQHLDIYVDRKPVEVPAGIGIAPKEGFIATLHTHDPTGIIHVESPTPGSFSLGQFFAVWGLRLSKQCIGGLCSEPVRLYVNGEQVKADPTKLVLAEHQEIVLTYGPPPQDIPRSFDFAQYDL